MLSPIPHLLNIKCNLEKQYRQFYENIKNDKTINYLENTFEIVLETDKLKSLMYEE